MPRRFLRPRSARTNHLAERIKKNPQCYFNEDETAAFIQMLDPKTENEKISFNGFLDVTSNRFIFRRIFDISAKGADTCMLEDLACVISTIASPNAPFEEKLGMFFSVLCRPDANVLGKDDLKSSLASVLSDNGIEITEKQYEDIIDKTFAKVLIISHPFSGACSPMGITIVWCPFCFFIIYF